jgi:hypothetical protein
LTVGAFSKLPVGEYSSRIRPSPSTSKRASPAVTVAPVLATPSANLTGVVRLTGEVGEVSAGEAVLAGEDARVAAALAAAPLAPVIGMASATAATAAVRR